MRIKSFLVALGILVPLAVSAQFTDATTGLLQMPSAEMQKSGTFFVTNNFLNPNATPTPKWIYTTFSYGFSIAFWSRLEVAYVCTIIDGKKQRNPSQRDMVMFNQDRHFAARFQVMREGDLWEYMPSIVVGLSDPVSNKGADYIGSDVSANNGYFNRTYIAASKHFKTPVGLISGHLAYIYNRRLDYRLNGPCAGVCWSPVWLTNQGILDEVKIIAEYDSRTVNVGTVVSLFGDHVEGMFEWQGFRWINFGARFKISVK